jgi:multiple sugar transport system substrate-binding protein
MMPAKKPGAGIRGQDFVTISGGWAEVINGAIAPEKADLAWEWLKFVYSKGEALSHFIEIPGHLPARWDIAEDPSWLGTVEEYTKWGASKLVPLTTFRPGLPAYPKISDVVQEATEKILLGESPEDVLDWYATKVIGIVGIQNTIRK